MKNALTISGKYVCSRQVFLSAVYVIFLLCYRLSWILSVCCLSRDHVPFIIVVGPINKSCPESSLSLEPSLFPSFDRRGDQCLFSLLSLGEYKLTVDGGTFGSNKLIFFPSWTGEPSGQTNTAITPKIPVGTKIPVVQRCRHYP